MVFLVHWPSYKPNSPFCYLPMYIESEFGSFSMASRGGTRNEDDEASCVIWWAHKSQNLKQLDAISHTYPLNHSVHQYYFLQQMMIEVKAVVDGVTL